MVIIAVSTNYGHPRSDAAKLIQNDLVTNISQMPDLVGILCQLHYPGRQFVVGIGDNQNFAHKRSKDAEETPKPNHQTPRKLQSSMFKICRHPLGTLCDSGFLGAWMLKFGISDGPEYAIAQTRKPILCFRLAPRLLSARCHLATSDFPRK